VVCDEMFGDKNIETMQNASKVR